MEIYIPEKKSAIPRQYFPAADENMVLAFMEKQVF